MRECVRERERGRERNDIKECSGALSIVIVIYVIVIATIAVALTGTVNTGP